MKKIVFLVLFLVLCFMPAEYMLYGSKSATGNILKGDLVRVTDKDVILRSKATTNSRVIQKLQLNDVVKVLAVGKMEGIGEHGENPWYKVQHTISYPKTITGWVYGAFLARVNPSIPVGKLGWIYPIGWSKDGKFAYIHEHSSVLACEGECSLRIIDFITNKVVWEKSDCFEGAIQEYWLKGKSSKVKTFKKLVKKYRILPARDYILKSFPVRHKGKVFDISVSQKIKKGASYGEKFPYISRVSIYLRSNSKKKLIHSQKFTPQLPLMLTLMKKKENGLKEYGQTFGFFKSPYEDRIAIIRTGYDPHEMSGEILVIGAKLD